MVNLTKLELRGFKSFADKVTIPFREGVTAIIGPNGCGKSNIGDAIRWTLGARGKNQLRSKNTLDVIFAGSEKRKSMSYCEVSMCFNNADRRIFPKLDFDEVVISRRLDKSGISEYYVNNSRVKLSDLTAFLQDTGVGKEGYSIIGQGRVKEIIDSNPKTRRAIFEEAAEIATFKSNKEDSEARLAKSLLNMQTIDSAIAELERSIGPMRKQAEIAKQYLQLREELKYNEVNLYIYNYENSQSIKKKIQDKLDAVIAQLKIADEEFFKCSELYNKSIDESAEIDGQYDSCNAELMQKKVAAAQIEGEAGILRERISNLEREIERLKGEIGQIDAQLLVSDNQLKACEGLKAQAEQEYNEANREYDEINKRYTSLAKTLAGAESDLEASNLDYVSALEKLNQLKANVSNIVAEKSINEERAKTLLDLVNQKKRALDDELTQLSIAEGKLKAANERNAQLRELLNNAQMDKKTCQETIAAYDADISRLNSNLSMAQGALELHIAMKEDYSAFGSSVQKLMQDAKRDRLLGSKILGVLANAIEVPKELNIAIESVLGNALQYVIVERGQDANDLIDYLQQKHYGRATFRPLATCRPRRLAPEYMGVLNEPGCYGLACDLIKYDKRFEAFILQMLGSTVIVNNKDNGLMLFKKYNQGFRIVTLDGRVFARSGEISGGSRETTQKYLLSQDLEINKCKDRVKELKDNLALLAKNKQEEEERIVALDGEIESIEKERSELRILIELEKSKSTQSEEVVARLQEEISGNSEQYELVRQALKSNIADLEALDALEKLTLEKKDEYNALVESKKTAGTQQKSEQEELNERIMQLRVAVASKKGEIERFEADLFRYRKEAQDLEQEKLEVVADLRRNEEALDKIVNAPKKAKLSPEEEAHIKALEDKIAELSGRKRTISDEIKALDDRKNELTEKRQQLTEQKIRNENMLDNVDVDMRNMQQRILEEYDLTYTTALQFKDAEFKSHGALTVIADLKKSINRLGDVNLLAVDTLKDLEDRLNFQTSQREDILKAIEDIRLVIADLVDKMETKFMAAFNAINENFKVIFSQLFNGGTGELRLSYEDCEENDVLNAGIDIFAQPPGKKLKDIGSLSGGEQTLIAISILFAILKLKPMPFCLLDEVEAALDDSNARLFAEFLHKYSDFTQFIVITHRKPTMSMADSIFGVTMEEKGVTKIVSVEFEEAIKHASEDD